MRIPFLPSFRVFSTRFSIRFALLTVALLWTSPIALHAQSVTFAGSGAVNFGSVNVCPAGATTPAPCSQTQTLSYNVSAGTTIGSIKILTTGDPNLDFEAKVNDTSTTLCKAQTYASATACTVDVTFAPLAPGARRAPSRYSTATTMCWPTTYIYGTEPVRRSPSTHRGRPWTAAFPSWVAASRGPRGRGSGRERQPLRRRRLCSEGDSGGGWLHHDPHPEQRLRLSHRRRTGRQRECLRRRHSGNKLYEVLSAGGYVTVNTVGSGFISYPWGVAVDGSGNVFVADYGSGTVEEILAADGYTDGDHIEQYQ